MPRPRISRKAVLILLLLGASVPYFVNLGVSSIWDANEAFYAQAPREMMAANDYVNPSFNFQLRYNKPVLSYWEVAAAYRAFGVSEWSERLPIALGGIVLIATAFGLGQLAGGTEAGLLAALVLAASPRVLLLARRDIARGEELTLAHDGQECAKHSLQLHPTPSVHLHAPSAL